MYHSIMLKLYVLCIVVIKTNVSIQTCTMYVYEQLMRQQTRQHNTTDNYFSKENELPRVELEHVLYVFLVVCRSSSLCSVYQLLRCGLCPYFYLCANQYTVLFVSAGVRGCSSLSALITPTTSGMREALQREGLYHIYPCWGIYTHTHACVYCYYRGRAKSPPGTLSATSI